MSTGRTAAPAPATRSVPRPRRAAAHPAPGDLAAADVRALVRELRHRGATSEDELQFRPSLDELPHERFRAALAAACEQGLVLRTCRGDLEALVD